MCYSRFHELCKSWPSQSWSFTVNQGNLVCCEYTYGGRSGSQPVLKSLNLHKKTSRKRAWKSWLKRRKVFRTNPNGSFKSHQLQLKSWLIKTYVVINITTLSTYINKNRLNQRKIRPQWYPGEKKCWPPKTAPKFAVHLIFDD